MSTLHLDNKELNKKSISILADFYKKHLIEDVISFWEGRTVDAEFGGCLTSFDRSGNLTDTDKYIWMQGRQLWMFSALYNRIEKRAAWLDIAKHCRNFIIRYAYEGNGRWYYLLARNGNVIKGTISIYTDMFVLCGLCEYAVATGNDEDIALIRETFDNIKTNIFDSKFKGFYPFAWNSQYKRHSIYMILLHTASVVEQVLGKKYTQLLIDYCLEQILYIFSKDDYEVLFESLALDNSVIDTWEGRQIMPGHALESMWFCMEEGRRRKDRSIIERSIQIVDWMYRRGYDYQFGGIYYTLDINGEQPDFKDWLTKRNILWNEKVFWPNAEALYALALAAIESDSNEYFERFLDLHHWCQKHFYDKEYGEWYMVLNRDGTPRLTHKGGMQKAAFHIPRALMMIVKLFEEYIFR